MTPRFDHGAIRGVKRILTENSDSVAPYDGPSPGIRTEQMPRVGDAIKIATGGFWAQEAS